MIVENEEIVILEQANTHRLRNSLRKIVETREVGNVILNDLNSQSQIINKLDNSLMHAETETAEIEKNIKKLKKNSMFSFLKFHKKKPVEVFSSKSEPITVHKYGHCYKSLEKIEKNDPLDSISQESLILKNLSLSMKQTLSEQNQKLDEIFCKTDDLHTKTNVNRKCLDGF